MEQLLLHLIGDYVTQTQWMASRKRANPLVALIHAVVYSVPFLLLTHSFWALFAIVYTHFLIDYYALARYVVFAKNWLTDHSLRWSDCQATGYPAAVPVWMATWLTIIADNTLHLGVNYAALRWL